MEQEPRWNLHGWTMEHSDLICSGALVYCKDTRRYLFLLRNGAKYDGSWGLVGGKINLGESPTLGLLREIIEETQIDLGCHKIVPLEKFTGNSGKFVYYTYLIAVEQEFVPNLNFEHRGYCWVKLEDHPRPLHPGLWKTINFDGVMTKIKALEAALDQ